VIVFHVVLPDLLVLLEQLHRRRLALIA